MGWCQDKGSVWLPSQPGLAWPAGAQNVVQMNRPSKKSETLQVRLPHGIKRDFMERCRLEGRAASEVLRGFIDSYLARPVEILTSERTAMARRRIL